ETPSPLSADAGPDADPFFVAIPPLLSKRSAIAQQPAPPPVVAIVGRPNVGKSTLINTLLGQERMVVFELPGTTRDSVDTTVSHRGRSYIFTDTAGIRRRGRIERGIEGYSVARAMRAMGRSDVALLILDAVEGITEQDTKIAGLALKQGRACLLLVNKWDLRQGDDAARRQYELDLRRRLPFLPWAPVLFGSALIPDSVSEGFPRVAQVVSASSSRTASG